MVLTAESLPAVTGGAVVTGGAAVTRAIEHHQRNGELYMDDLMHRLVEVRAFLTSARNLSEELEKLHSTQQMQCDILERRISQEYRRAYEMSQLSC